MLLKKSMCFFLAFVCWNLAFAQSEKFPVDHQAAIDLHALKQLLDKAPLESVDKAQKNPVLIELPFPGNTLLSYWVEASPIQAPEYAARTPDIKTYLVKAVHNPLIYGRITYSPGGLYALIFSPEGDVLIKPKHLPDSSIHDVYFAKDEMRQHPMENFCQKPKNIYPDDRLARIEEQISNTNQLMTETHGAVRKTFRLAIVTTGEFYQNNGANLSQATAVVVSTVNALQAIYDRDLAMRFELVGPEIYTNPDTDPFPAASSNSVIELAAAALDLTLNVNDYDVGHAFHNTIGTGNPWAEGGLAQLAATCNSNPVGTGGYIKGLGWSAKDENASFRWIQLVAHEIGHMFFARHTFNGAGESCSNFPIEPCDLTTSISCESAYEIGSGSTIMAYRDICLASQNIQGLSSADNYFHTNSLQRMIGFINSLSCPVDASTGNTPPVANAGADFTIPGATPFILTGSATDADGDALTYCWEQYDEDDLNDNPTQGYTGTFAAASPIAPLFRSYPPTASPQRMFPALTSILAGTNNGQTFEALPTIGRTMNFRMTVRDNNPNGGGTHCDNNVITVAGTAGPFAISSQDTPETWTADGTSQATVTWSVANTNLSPVNCASVEILFSADGGLNFDYTIAANVPNNGSYTFLVPSIPTFDGRVMVKSVGNIFFDINNADITINSTCAAFAGSITPDDPVNLPAGNAGLNLNLSPVYGNVLTGVNSLLNSSDPIMTIAFDGGAGTCSNASNLQYHEQLEFYVDIPGQYTFTRTSNAPLINLYELAFDPGASCNNWLGTNGVLVGGSISLYPSVTVTLSPGIKYIMAVSTFDTSMSYTVEFSSPSGGQIYDAPPAPSGFSYTYIIVDQSSGLISGFDTGSDLTSYSAGTYIVYGVSYETGENLSPYVGQPLTNLESDIFGSLICLDFSLNSVDVVIEGDCVENLTVTDEVASGLYEANSSLSTLGKVTVFSGDTAHFQSGGNITLTVDFEVQAGAEFNAIIQGGCLGVSVANALPVLDVPAEDYELFRTGNMLVLNWHSHKKLATFQLQDEQGNLLFDNASANALADDVFQFDLKLLKAGSYKIVLETDSGVLQKDFFWSEN